MTHYYYYNPSDGSVRSSNATYSATTTDLTFSSTDFCKKHRKPTDDFPEENEKLDKFLGAFTQKGTNDGK